MRLRNKIFTGLGGVLVVGIAAAMITLSHESPCPPMVADGSGAEHMRALMHRCYGVPAGLRVENVARPTPGDGQVLIKVRAASINPAEWHRTTGTPYIIRMGEGIGAPNDSKAGYDFAGTIEAVGPNVTRLKVGDEVFGGVPGALAQYAIGRDKGSIVSKPENMSFEEAAAIPIAAVTALQGLRDYGGIKAGQKVLVNGASGGVGTYAVQIAKSFGAEVTGVCSTRNVEMVRSLGADHVIDYTQQDFTAGQVRYDLILDNVGNHGFHALEQVTQPQGTIVIVGGSKKGAFLGPIKRVAWSKIVDPFLDQRITFYIAKMNQKDLEFLASLVREGKMRSVIDRRYPLAETGAALEYLGSQRARGKIVITMD